MSAWFDDNGITIGAGITAFNSQSSVSLSWEQVAERINELLEQGEYTAQDNIDGAKSYEIRKISESLWYLHQDCKVEYFIAKDMFVGGFPDSTERIAKALRDENTLKSYIEGLDDLAKQYRDNRDVLRFNFHKPEELLIRLKDLQLERREFITKPDFEFSR